MEQWLLQTQGICFNFLFCWWEYCGIRNSWKVKETAIQQLLWNHLPTSLYTQGHLLSFCSLTSKMKLKERKVEKKPQKNFKKPPKTNKKPQQPQQCKRRMKSEQRFLPQIRDWICSMSSRFCLWPQFSWNTPYLANCELQLQLSLLPVHAPQVSPLQCSWWQVMRLISYHSFSVPLSFSPVPG